MLFKLLATIFLYHRDNRKESTQEALSSTSTSFSLILFAITVDSISIWSLYIKKFYLSLLHFGIITTILILVSFFIVIFYKKRLFRIVEELEKQSKTRNQWKIVLNIIIFFLIALTFDLMCLKPFYTTTL